MTESAWILISILILLVLLLVVFFINKKKKKREFSKLTWIAFLFIFASLIFSDNRITGYTLIGIGIFFGVLDIIIQLRKKNKKMR